MKRPEADGHIYVLFTDQSDKAFLFKNISHVYMDNNVLQINYFEQVEYYPLSNIQFIRKVYNSKQYLSDLEKYANAPEHKHNWVHNEDSVLNRYGRMICSDVEPNDMTACLTVRYLTDEEIEDFIQVLTIREQIMDNEVRQGGVSFDE